MLNKNSYIEQLAEGDRIDDLFLVKAAKLAETKAGKPYLVLTIADRSGELSGPVWEHAEQLQEICRPGQFVQLQGQVQSYRDKPQLKVETVRAVDAALVPMDAFVQSSPHSIEAMGEELQALVRSVTDPHLRKLLGHFFRKEVIWLQVREAPAAKGFHHAYVGGLLEHILSMGKVADLLASHYQGVDRSLLIAAALLHDIGKLHELAAANGLIEYTDAGRLKGHLSIGSEMVAEAARRQSDFPAELLVHLQHCILSHHGRLEFGSPVVPMTVEAFMLSAIDELDAKMNIFEQLRRKMKNEGMAWSEYQRSLERYLYLSPLPAAEKETPAETAPAAIPVKQQKLF